jgi:tetratricopeptide (TPR) repeat protein
MTSNLKNIKTLREDFESLGDGNNEACIAFYELNLDSINSIDITVGKDEYNTKLRLDCEYGLSLSKAKKYEQAVAVLSDAIPMYENAPSENQSELANNSYCETLTWNYAKSLHETGALSEAIKQFKRLVKINPNDDNYSNWVNTLNSQRITFVTRYLWWGLIVWTILDWTIFDYFFKDKMSLTLTNIGLTGMLITGLLELYNYRLKKKLPS